MGVVELLQELLEIAPYEEQLELKVVRLGRVVGVKYYPFVATFGLMNSWRLDAEDL